MSVKALATAQRAGQSSKPNLCESAELLGRKSNARRQMTGGARICQSDPKLFFNLQLDSAASNCDVDAARCAGEKNLHIVLIFQCDLVAAAA